MLNESKEPNQPHQTPQAELNGTTDQPESEQSDNQDEHSALIDDPDQDRYSISAKSILHLKIFKLYLKKYLLKVFECLSLQKSIACLP